MIIFEGKSKKNSRFSCKFQKESLSLQRVFHSIRFKVNKVWLAAASLFFVYRLYNNKSTRPADASPVLLRKVNNSIVDGSADDVQQFVGDRLLTALVVLKVELPQQFVCIIRSRLHGYHTGCML